MSSWSDINALYQVYPRSFQDTNGDGTGDINGITQHLDYIATVADAIWLSPLYQSPQKDFGYDISSFVAFAPEYGTMSDFEALVAKAHARGLKVFMDLVPNHTSDQHEWFTQSRSSRNNSKRDWYVWRDPIDGHEPNNWVSMAGGKSWEYDAVTGQYYLHSWLKSQPDLNWQNPAVREAIADIMRFWLTRGVDGFRVDAVWVLAKDPDYRDDELQPGGDAGAYSGYRHTMCRNGEQLGEYIAFMADVANEQGGLLVLEYYSTPEFGDSFPQLYALQSVRKNCTTFFFDPLNWPLTAQAFGDGIAAYIAGLPVGTIPVICFGNHDQPRMVSRYGGEAQARLLAMLEFTLPGVPCVYNGDELGMENGSIPPGQGRDGFGGTGIMAGRDPERTPMQWNGTKNAGFSVGTPWLPVHSQYKTHNAASESDDSVSVLALYRALFTLRAQSVAWGRGTFAVLGYGNNILAYERAFNGATYTVYSNFNDYEHSIELGGTAICSSLLVTGVNGATGHYVLAPFESIIVKKGNQQ